MHACLFSKTLSSPKIFPIRLYDDVLDWKILVGYDLSTNVFALSINDLSFKRMPYQAQVILKGPQNITWGGCEIILNGVQVHKGWTQFSADDTIDEWLSEIEKEPTTDIAIK